MDNKLENFKLENFPVAFFASIMGMGGLTLATMKAEQIFARPHMLSYFLLAFLYVLFAALMYVYALKIIRHRQAVCAEFNHPIKQNFFPAISISLLLLSIAASNGTPLTSLLLFCAGAFLHLWLTFVIVGRWIGEREFAITSLNPTWFIPAVGNIVVPMVSMHHGYVGLSWFFFSIGAFFWILLLSVFFARIIFKEPLILKLRPTLFILIAPPAVGFISYFEINRELDSFANILYYFALFIFLLLITKYKTFIKIPFALSWWSYSFPLAAFNIATYVMYQQSKNPCFLVFASVLYILLWILIITLIILTIKAALKNEICVPEESQ